MSALQRLCLFNVDVFLAWGSELQVKYNIILDYDIPLNDSLAVAVLCDWEGKSGVPLHWQHITQSLTCYAVCYSMFQTSGLSEQTSFCYSCSCENNVQPSIAHEATDISDRLWYGVLATRVI